jgi:hypothetical protein
MAKVNPSFKNLPTKLKKIFNNKLAIVFVLSVLVVGGVWAGYKAIPQKDKDSASASNPLIGYGCLAYGTSQTYGNDCGTAISDSNLGTTSATCTTVVVGSPTTCVLTLTGGSSTTYGLPDTGMLIKIGSATGSVNCTLTNTGCVISGSTLTISNVPTVGQAAGLEAPIKTSFDSGTTYVNKGTMGITSTSTPVTNTHIQTVACTATTPTAPGVASCNLTLKSTGNPTDLNGTVLFTLVAGKTCTVTVNNGVLTGNPCTVTNLATGTYTATALASVPGSTSMSAGTVVITDSIVDTLLIPKTATTITESPNPEAAGLSIYGKSDYSLTVKDARLNKVGTVDTFCYFKIKEATAIDGNSDKGYEKLTSTVNGGLGVLTSTTSGAAYDTTTKSYKVTYDNTNGANIKLASGKQLYTDYNLQIRCTRSDSQAFARDQKINFLFGAYSVVDISGQV